MTSEPIYTNIVPTELEADWTASYTGPPRPVQPAYIDGYEVGVAVSEIRTFNYRAASKFCVMWHHLTRHVIHIWKIPSKIQVSL